MLSFSTFYFISMPRSVCSQSFKSPALLEVPSKLNIFCYYNIYIHNLYFSLIKRLFLRVCIKVLSVLLRMVFF